MAVLTDAQMVLELERRYNEERLRFYAPTPLQMAFHLDPRRSRWNISGNRVGKTVGLGVYVDLYALGKDALKYLDDWPELVLLHYKRLAAKAGSAKLRKWYTEHANEGDVNSIVQRYRDLCLSFPSPARIWVCSETFEVQRDVVQREIVGDARTFAGGWLPKSEVAPKGATYRDKDVLDTLTLTNGSVIGWKSYDQGREKFQGTSIHLIAYDEEPPKDIHDECAMRVFDVRGTIVAAMTPLKGMTFVSDMVVDNDKKPVEKRDPEVMYLSGSWDDNPYLSEDEKKRLEATMDESEKDARQFGRFLVPGRPVFKVASLRQYLEGCVPGDKGYLRREGKEIRFEPDAAGYLEVWEEPQDGVEYVVGADVAEGLAHGDYSTAVVYRRDTGAHVALWHGHIDADLFGDELAMLGYWYNEAVLAPEANNHGLTTITRLKHLSYPNIYRMMQLGKSTDKEQPRYGWYTSGTSKPLMIGHLQGAIRQMSLQTKSKRFVDEAFSFVRDDKGEMGAVSGKWDDVVMAAAIAQTVHATTDYDIPAPSSGRGARDDGERKFGDPGWVHPSVAEDRRKQRQSEDWEEVEPWAS